MLAYAKTKAQISAANQRLCLLLQYIYFLNLKFRATSQQPDVSDFVEKPKDRFCHDAAQIAWNTFSCMILYCINERPFDSFFLFFN